MSDVSQLIIDHCYQLYYLWAAGEDYKEQIDRIIPLLHEHDPERAQAIWDKATASFKNRNGQRKNNILG